MKAVEIRERDGLESDLAISYHNMGIYTQELGDYKNAKKWYMKAVEIRERLDQMVTWHLPITSWVYSPIRRTILRTRKNGAVEQWKLINA